MKKENRLKGITSYFKGDSIGENLVNKVVDTFSNSTLMFSNKAIVLYYKYYSNFRVYTSVLNGRINLMKDSTDYYSLTDIYSTYNEKYGEVEYVNVLSESYVYLTKSGVYSQGEDLRDSNSKLCDDIFFILFATGCLDKIIFITKNFDCSSYGFIEKIYSNVNRDRWSMSLVDKGLSENNRLSVLLYPIDDTIVYDSITDRVYTKPKELFLDLYVYCQSKNLFLSHCGDLGIQIAVK